MANRSAGKTALLMSALIAATMLLSVTSQDVFTIGPHKDPRCHMPEIVTCNTSMYPILDFELTNWFYHAPFKSCRPLYGLPGKHSCATNRDLPLTQDECEKICGEPCGEDAQHVGLCRMEEHCSKEHRIKTHHPRPCHAYEVKCCSPPGLNRNAAIKKVAEPVKKIVEPVKEGPSTRRAGAARPLWAQPGPK